MSDQHRVEFHFEGRRLTGVEGESVAKALFEAGIRTLSYSVKYKRPRGLHCARGRCVMCHMEIDGTPGVPSCITPLRAGITVRREDYRPFYAPLLTAFARRIPFPAGFYYRMFTRPAFLRKFFLNSLRPMAGVGRLNQSAGSSPAPSPADFPDIKARYDVIVIGAGMSGMSAAAAAAEHGARVLLVDEYPLLGGHAIGFQPEAATAARDELIGRVTSASAVTHLPLTTAQAFYPPDTVLLGPGGSVPEGRPLPGLKRVRASHFIFATGAYDLTPTFGNNDVPGLFGTRAIRVLIERDGLIPGKRAAVYGTGDDLAATVDLLRHHKVAVVATVDPAAGASPLDDSAVRHVPASNVETTHGGTWIDAITIDGGHGRESIGCDLLCTAFPGQGAYELAYQAGFQLEMSPGEFAEARVMVPTTASVDKDGTSFFVVGELAGIHSWREKITSGERAAAAAQSPATG